MPCGGGGNRDCIGDDVGDGVGAIVVALAVALAVANDQWSQIHSACVQHGYHLR